MYEIMLNLGVTVDVEIEEFADELINFFESKDWDCGGGIYYSDDPCNDEVRDKWFRIK